MVLVLRLVPVLKCLHPFGASIAIYLRSIGHDGILVSYGCGVWGVVSKTWGVFNNSISKYHFCISVGQIGDQPTFLCGWSIQ